MKIYYNQLISTLNQGVKPVWLIFGDEPWQKNDSLAQIKAHAQQQGFAEIIRFSADDKFDWQQILDEYQSLSLFSNLRIIEIELTSAKIGDKGNKALLALNEQLQNDVVLIIHGPRVDAPTSNRKWFKALTSQGCYLPLYDLEGKSLQQWLFQQAKHYQLQLEPAIFPLLIELFEGNVLALEQELQKLSILYGQNKISLEDAQQLVIKQAKFNPFQLVDALLLGNLNKVVRILDQQQQEGAAIGQLIWFIHKEIKQLMAMQTKLTQNTTQASLFKEYRIWEKRKPLYQHALNNISPENCQLALSRLADVDLLSKSNSDFNHFILLADVCISLYHGNTTQVLALNYEYA
ncbi:MAG: DNA polymerase III subunit delta [Gammaproteobacteria bacterium]|nr:MAG: DNA polymerase III subunit delta [Gammaproteobacteria bacterium]